MSDRSHAPQSEFKKIAAALAAPSVTLCRVSAESTIVMATTPRCSALSRPWPCKSSKSFTRMTQLDARHA
jgi:hypothetical protein